MNTVSGPMFEPKRTDHWRSMHDKDGAHYNTYGCRDEHGMAALREFFPDGEANEYNLVLFSTSGVHGMYTTIEEAEQARNDGGEDLEDDDAEPYFPGVTFCLIQPRLCTIRCGNCQPETAEDFAFLKKLRETSWAVACKIGAAP